MRSKSLLFVSLLFFLITLPVNVFGQGGGAGWIERFSGPGGFIGTEFFIPGACIAKDGENNTRFLHLFGCFDPSNRPTWWIDFAWGTYESDNDPLVENTSVKLNTLEVRATRPLGFVELGFGAGGYHFKGDNFDDFWKFAIPLKANFLPFKNVSDRYGKVLQFWAKGIFVSGRLSGEDFEVPVDRFDENWDFVLSAGIVVDFRGAIRGR